MISRQVTNPLKTVFPPQTVHSQVSATEIGLGLDRFPGNERNYHVNTERAILPDTRQYKWHNLVHVLCPHIV